jgi:hypothetical protein
MVYVLPALRSVATIVNTSTQPVIVSVHHAVVTVISNVQSVVQAVTPTTISLSRTKVTLSTVNHQDTVTTISSVK